VSEGSIGPVRQPPRWLLGGWSRYATIFALDILAISAAFYLGYLIRLEGDVAAEYRTQYVRYLPLLLAIRLPLHLAFRIHRWSYRLSGLYEAFRVILTCATGTATFVTICYFVQRGGPPRSVVAIEFLLTTSFLGALRFSPRLTHDWYLRQLRSRSGGRVRTLIVGAGSTGGLLARDLERSERHPYEVVGFVDDNPSKWRTSIAGRPVLGPVESLREIAERRDVSELFFAEPDLPAARLRRILSDCAELKLNYKILPVSFDYLKDRMPMSILQELAPENLLHRSPVAFEPERMRRLIEGRRVLVTGAAGSIGSEICRQLARYGPARLVMLDLDENGLYLLLRALEHEHPAVTLRVEVADIRDESRIGELFADHRVQDVFHAAAHKHVPLMEDAPGQAIKNNVTGCRVVATAADATAVERFVLISTDKAVEPTSIMGASKRIAELVVADLARSSPTRFSAVRFGNVLGSAGSVVPLFKEQIARGGPVTVTHRDCRRYIMTVAEAVGLVLLVGFSDLGDLCILEMGEPIRILDLARLMITISGRAPGRDVEIVFTGLRPGEKLDERLMTDSEAARSRVSGEMIRSVEVAPPSGETLAALVELEALARTGAAADVVAGIQRVLPDYTPSPLWSGAPATPSSTSR